MNNVSIEQKKNHIEHSETIKIEVHWFDYGRGRAGIPTRSGFNSMPKQMLDEHMNQAMQFKIQ